MRNLTKFVQNTNAKHALWQKGNLLVLGVSGGVDSMCLLHLFSVLRHKENLTIIVAHVNYKSRGKCSDHDQVLVETFCKDNNILCESKVLTQPVKNPSEQKWREIRHIFFKEILQKHKAAGIVLGHNQNDLAETLLLNLLRGSGLLGLAAMTYKQEKTIRPLLNVSREDITHYCKANNLTFAEDLSNNDITFTRNKIRKNLLPYLKKNYNTNIIQTLSQTAEVLSEDYAYIQDSFVPFWSYSTDTNSVSFLVDDFLSLSSSVQKLSLRKIISQLSDTIQQPSFGIIKEWCLLIKSAKNKTHFMEYKGLKISKNNATVKITCLY